MGSELIEFNGVRLEAPLGAGEQGLIYLLQESGPKQGASFVKVIAGDPKALEDLVCFLFLLKAEKPHGFPTILDVQLRSPGLAYAFSIPASVCLSAFLGGPNRGDWWTEKLQPGSEQLQQPSAKELLQALAGSCLSMAALHQRGWTHGRLQPKNLLYLPGQPLWIADFPGIKPGATRAACIPWEALDKLEIEGDLAALGRLMEWILESAKDTQDIPSIEPIQKLARALQSPQPSPVE